MKPSGIGGMAVIEGVMMKNKDEYAVAVRKPNKEIAIEKKTHKDFAEKVKLFKLPIFRGVLAFVDSMVIGVKVLNFAASFFEEEEEQAKPGKKTKAAKTEDKKSGKAAKNKEQASEPDGKVNKKPTEGVEAESGDDKEEKSNALLMAAAVVISLAISITFFMVLPVLISNVFKNFVNSYFWLSVLEAVIRIAIFIGYILVVSLMPDIRRVFMYHGAEHKTINCLENGFELTLENVKWQSKQHKRCGTSFMLLVMLISVVFFIILQPETLMIRIISRVLLVPVIAGISYEFIRYAGRKDNIIINILSKPGLWMQALTTKEPEDSMIEVAIQSVDAVFDWRAFLETYKTDDNAAGKKQEAAKKKPQGKTQGAPQPQPALNSMRGSSNQQRQVNRTGTANLAAMNQPTVKKNEEEDDEILKALDKYLDFGDNEPTRKVGN